MTIIKDFFELSSYPFISPYTFRLVSEWGIMHQADFQYCTHPLLHKIGNGIDFQRMQDGDKVFVVSDLLDAFFEKVHPEIPRKYILISARGDSSFSERYTKFLDDEKLIHCFSSNVSFSHPKLTAIPLGMQNRHWRKYEHPQSNIKTLAKIAAEDIEKSGGALLSFSIDTNAAVRKPVLDLFKNSKFVTNRQFNQTNRLDDEFVSEYFREIKRHKFVICPRGNGFDCHRNWESLYLGSFPIVQNHVSYDQFRDFPIWFIDDWKEVTENSLEKKYEELKEKSKNFSHEKLYMDYWMQEIWSKK